MRLLRLATVRDDAHMPNIQPPAEISAFLKRLHGREIAELQVLGINSLKSLHPTPADLTGAVVTTTTTADRTFTIHAGPYSIACDLQRTGRLRWLESAEPYRFSAESSRPTARLVLSDGTGLDLTEPAKTKRIAVIISVSD